MPPLKMSVPHQEAGRVVAVTDVASEPNMYAAEDLAECAFLQAYKEMIGGVFDRAAATYDRQGPPVFSHFGRQLVEWAGVRHGDTVLDVGAGRGAVLLPAAQQVGARGYAVGIDLAPQMVRLTRSDLRHAGIAHATVHCMDAEQLRFPTGSFDRVLCGFTLHLLLQPARALAEARRVLKPGGRLAVTTWGDGDAHWAWFEDLLRRTASAVRPAPPVLHQPAELMRLLQAVGFTRVQVASESRDIVYASEAEWWASRWSRGERGVLESMTLPVAQAFKTAAFERMQSLRQAGGFHQCVRALVATATTGR
jgi:ubiquinone/menaquinone biosynthesis C-methylase UbiE